MDYKQIMIEIQKNMIDRLQQECTEKTTNIIALGEQLIAKGQECDKLKQTIIEIEEIAKKSMCEGKMISSGWLYQFIEQKISEVNND